MKRKPSISNDQAIVQELRDDPEFAAEYLKAAIDDTDEPKVLLLALRQIAQAKGGLAKVAEAAGIKRESLYRALSRRGNPRLSTLVAVAKALGLKLTVEAVNDLRIIDAPMGRFSRYKLKGFVKNHTRPPRRLDFPPTRREIA